MVYRCGQQIFSGNRTRDCSSLPCNVISWHPSFLMWLSGGSTKAVSVLLLAQQNCTADESKPQKTNTRLRFKKREYIMFNYDFWVLIKKMENPNEVSSLWINSPNKSQNAPKWKMLPFEGNQISEEWGRSFPNQKWLKVPELGRISDCQTVFL